MACTVVTYGLRWRLPAPDPWLPGSDGGGVDVVVELAAGALARDLPSRQAARDRATPDRYAVRWPGCLRAEVCAGARIRLDPERDHTTMLATYCWGPLAVAVLAQRALSAVHATALRAPTGAVLLAGATGLGKSTLAAALVQQGWPLISDDVVALESNADGRGPRVASGPPRLKLWPDALGLLGLAGRDLPRLHPDFDKCAWRVPAVRAGSRHPVAGVVVLDGPQAGGPDLQRCREAEALPLLLGLGAAPQVLGDQAIDRAVDFANLAELARRVPVWRWRPSRGPEWPPLRLAGRLRAALREVG